LLSLLCIDCTAKQDEQQKGTFTDVRNGIKYKTVKIGKQTWMAENLNYNAAGSKCYGEGFAGVSADSIAKNCAIYGRMYEWETAMAACPPGWHLPSSVEWDNLVAAAGSYNIAGKKLKARSGWSASFFDYFYKGTDDFGFSALPARYRYSDRDGEKGFWWTATEKTTETKSEHPDDRSCANTYYMSNRHDGVWEQCFSKTSDYSVRCVDGSEEEAIAVQKAREAAIKAEIEKNVVIFTDARDGKKYRSVKIGKQTWMAENLNYKTDSSWCYENNESSCAQYGRLYDWKAAKAACPSGWHLPTNKEWEILLKTTGLKMLKAKSGWNSDGNGTDEFGFSAMPGGSYYSYFKDFSDAGKIGKWWTATEYYADDAHSLQLWYFDSVDFDEETSKDRGLSVRCLQN
jgi:uncharacterized protein (TIGR02145 family)